MALDNLYTHVSPPTDEEIKRVFDYVHNLRKVGDFDTAEKLLIEGLNYLQAFNNTAYNSHFIIYRAKILFEQKKYLQAEPIFRLGLYQFEMLNSFRKNYKSLKPGCHTDDSAYKFLLNTMSMFAIVLNEIGLYDEAEHLLKEIFEIKQHIFKPKYAGAINESTLRSMVRVAIILYSREKDIEAVEYLKSAFSWMSKMYGTCDKETQQINNSLCKVLRKLERYDEADYWFEQGSPNTEIPMFPFRN